MPALPRDKATDRVWLLGLLALAALLSLLATHWTFDMWRWQNDELLFRSTARWISDDLPGSLWATDQYLRGVQRLNAWLFALCLDLFGSPAGFKVARWVIVLAFASSVAPAWLLGRAAGATRVWAAIAALAAVLVPWAVLTGTFLTEPFAYPLFGWACLAIWNAAVNASLRADAVALLAIGLAMLARTGMVLLLVALAIVVVLQEARLASSARDLRNVPSRLVRRHPLLVAIGAVGLLAIVVGRGASLTGAQYEGVRPQLSQLTHSAAYLISGVASGVAFVPVIVALGFAITQLVRPSSPGALALASLVIGTLVTFTLAGSAGTDEERYVFYWALPCAVAMGVAASNRSASLPALAAGTGLVLVTMGERLWRPEIFDFWGYLLYPAESFQARVVRLGIDERLPLSLGAGLTSSIVIVLAAIAAALIAAPVPDRLRRAFAERGGERLPLARAAVAVGVLVILVGAVQAGWAMDKFVERGGGGRDLQARTTIARAAAGRDVGMWLPPAPADASRSAWEEMHFFTPSVTRMYRLGASQSATRFSGVGLTTMSVDEDTGRVVPARVQRMLPLQGCCVARVALAERPRAAPLPSLVVAATGQATAPLRGRVVARDDVLGMELLRVVRPASVRWTSGPSTDGAVAAGETQTIRVFPPVAAGSCLRLQLAADDAQPVRFRAGGGEVAVPPGARTELLVPIHARRATTVNVRVSGSSRASTGQSPLTGHVVAGGFAKCPPRAGANGSHA